MPERAAPAGLSAIWHAIVALVVRFFGRLRRLLSLYPSLPVAPLAGGGFADGLMAPTEEEAVARAAALQFPPGFLFGSATAAYQVEGGLDNCNWREWEQRGKRADGHPTVEGGRGAGEACDMWNRFEEDLVHMKALGLAVYRFSVEWSRVEPEEGQFDDAALERYRGWCVQLREAGIEPMVTLHHFTEPAWFCKKGGWEVRENVANFRRFTERVVASLGPLVSCWCTTNEMNGYAVCGWLAGVHPPGKQDDLKGLLRVIRHLLLAHREAAAAIRAGSASLPRAPSVLMALNHIWFTTDSWSPLANATVLVLNVIYNYCIPDALVTGRFPNFPLPFDALACACGWRDDLRSLEGSVDLLGVNHYYRSLVSWGVASESDAPPSPSDLFLKLVGARL